jgi:hypothetical protein
MFLLSILACGAFSSEYGEDLLPTQEQLAINLPVADSSAWRATGSVEWAPYYDLTRNVTETVNGMIKFVLGTVGTVTLLRPTWTNDAHTEAMWGPYSDSGLDPVETGLTVKAEDDGSYSWALFQVPNGGDLETDAVIIVAGEVDPGSTRTDATGRFAVDFTAASQLDPAVNLVGTFAVEYDYDAAGVAAVAAFEDYGLQNGQTWDALYAYEEEYEGSGWMDFAWLDDVDDSGTDELIAVRSRWQADGQGRGDAFATGGDLGDTTVTASNCWGSSFTTTYWTDSIGFGEAEGSEADCAFAEADYAEEADFALAD